MTSSDNTTASATRNEQLMLFEAIVLGIYGN